MMWWPDWGWLRRVAIAELAVVFVVMVTCILWVYLSSRDNCQVEHTLIRVGIHRHVQYYIDERHQICFAAGDAGFIQIDDPGCDRLLATYGEP